MSTVYYIAFMIGFAATALSHFDQVSNHYTDYKQQVRNIEVAPSLPTSCDLSLSRNFCNYAKQPNK